MNSIRSEPMRLGLLSALLLSQAAACDLYFLNNDDNHTKPPNLTINQEATDLSVSPTNLYDLKTSPDLSMPSTDLPFSISYIQRDCGAAIGTDNKTARIDNPQNNMPDRNCKAIFKLTAPNSMNFSIAGGTTLEFDTTYLAHNYNNPDTKVRFYENISFIAFAKDGMPHIIGNFPGFNTLINNGAITEIQYLKLPIIDNPYLAIVIEIESKSANGNTSNEIPQNVTANPAGITINSIKELKKQ